MSAHQGWTVSCEIVASKLVGSDNLLPCGDFRGDPLAVRLSASGITEARSTTMLSGLGSI